MVYIMKKARTTYSVAFKHDAANLVLDKGYTIQEACNAVGVGYTAMSRSAKARTWWDHTKFEGNDARTKTYSRARSKNKTD